MFHKLIITSIGVAVVGGVLLGTNAMSYLKTACSRVSTAAEESVPIEFQIDRARQMASDLAPEVKRSMHVIAKEEIAIERLNDQIANSEAKNDKSKDEILRLQSDLSDGRNIFRYAGHEYSRQEVKEDLGRRFSRFKVSDETLSHLKSMRDARARNLDAARQKLTALVSAQQKLQTDITNLEAKRKLVEVAQASSDLVIDDSQLARTKELISDIRTKLDVAAKLANADIDVQAEIPLDAAESEDVTEQVAAYFQLKSPRVEVEVATASFAKD